MKNNAPESDEGRKGQTCANVECGHDRSQHSFDGCLVVMCPCSDFRAAALPEGAEPPTELVQKALDQWNKFGQQATESEDHAFSQGFHACWYSLAERSALPSAAEPWDDKTHTINKIANEYHLPGPTNLREALGQAWEAGNAARRSK